MSGNETLGGPNGEVSVAAVAAADILAMPEATLVQSDAAKYMASLTLRNGVLVKESAHDGFYFGGSYFSSDDEANRGRMQGEMPPYHRAMYEKYYGQVDSESTVVDNVRNIFSRGKKEGQQ